MSESKSTGNDGKGRKAAKKGIAAEEAACGGDEGEIYHHLTYVTEHLGYVTSGEKAGYKSRMQNVISTAASAIAQKYLKAIDGQEEVGGYLHAFRKALTFAERSEDTNNLYNSKLEGLLNLLVTKAKSQITADNPEGARAFLYGARDLADELGVPIDGYQGLLNKLSECSPDTYESGDIGAYQRERDREHLAEYCERPHVLSPPEHHKRLKFIVDPNREMTIKNYGWEKCGDAGSIFVGTECPNGW